MTLASTAAPLAIYALLFQTVAFFALPKTTRDTWLPLVTGGVGAALTVGFARIFDVDVIGLGMPDLGIVALCTLGTVTLAAAVGTFMLLRPALRKALADPRVASLSRWAVAVQILIRIPVMTALIEEAVFRGVVFAALDAVYSPGVALWTSAALFGMWHVAPGLAQASANDATRRQSVAHVAMTLLAMTGAGLVLGWLRMETGSIWAPVAVHAAVNMTMAMFARVAGTRLATAAA